jgi:hypothetical protein
MAPASRWRQADERGVVLVWLAITLVVLLGVSAFAIDVSYWQLTKNREQRAADAAALAGAVSFPGNPSAANSSAAGVASSNGYPVGSVTPVASDGSCALGANADTTVCGGPGDQPYQYQVTVKQRVNNYFGGIFGINNTVVAATATAEYLKPLSMGSPSNQYGNDPDAVTSWPVSAGGGSPPNFYPNFWANIAGGNSIKQNGDAYAAGYCGGSTDGCSGTGANKNLDHKPDGYFYAVDFNDTATVNLQAFDPGFVQVGDNCQDGTANLAGAAALTDVPDYPEGDTNTTDIAKRYAPVPGGAAQTNPGYQYCTGDNIFTNNGVTGPAPATTFTVLKSTVPGDPNAATPVAGCDPITYPGYSGNLVPLLNSGGAVPGTSVPLATYFRQWVNLCQITGQAGDEYFIQINTDANSQGHNRFSLRAVTTGGQAAPVNLAANSYMGMYANVGGQSTQFFLARVPTAAAHHTLVLNFFDIGDAAAGSTGTLKILPPSDSTGIGASFSGCTWTGAAASGALGYSNQTPVGPWGPATAINDCVINGVNDVSANWNGQWSTVTIPIPSGYTCHDDDPQGCWVKINYQFTGGISDTTSWNAFLLGDPVRLTK